MPANLYDAILSWTAINGLRCEPPTYAFLELNGRHVTADVDETVELARSAAAGELEVDELTGWFDEHTEPVGGR